MKKSKYIILLVFVWLAGAAIAQNPVISLPTGLTVTVGQTIDVKLAVDVDLSPHNVLAYSFAFTYNANLLKVTAVQHDAKLQAFDNVTNTQQAGKVVLSGASATKISGSGTLITLTFEALASGYTNLNFVTAACVLNEGSPAATYQNGRIDISPKPSITVSPNSAFLAVGQTQQMNVGGNVSTPVTWGVTNPVVGNVSANGLFTATGHGKTKIFAVDNAELRDTTDYDFEVSAISLSFPADLQQWQGWEVKIPVKTTDFSALNIVSGEFSLSYRADVLQFMGVEKSGTLLANSSVSAGEVSNGKMKLAFASGQPIGTGTDDLVKLRFQVKLTAIYTSHLNFSEVIFNENIKAFTTNGSFTPKILPTLTLTPTAASLVAGDSLLFTAANGNPPYTWSVSDSRVAKIRQNGWLVAYEGGTTDLTVTDAVGATKTVSNIQVADMRMYFSADTLEQVETITYTKCFSDSVPFGRYAISSIQGEISVTNNKVKILDIETAGTMTEGWQKQVVHISDQRIKFYLAGATPFRKKGIAFKLKSELSPNFKEYDRSNVLFHNTFVNEGTPTPILVDGAIEGKIFTEQDKTICLGESTGILTVPDADGKTISKWKIRVRRPVATQWQNIVNTTAQYTHTPDLIGEWEYVAVVDGVDTKVANIMVKTIPDVRGVIRGDTIFCNTPQTLRYVVERRPTASEYRWNYTGTGVVLHSTQNVLDLEITHDVTPGVLEMWTANFCGESAEKLTLELKPTIQSTDFLFENKTYYSCDTIAFTDTSTGALDWTWSVTPATGALFTAGTTAASQHPKIQFTQAGVYTLKLKTTNSCRVDSMEKTVMVEEFKNGELMVDKLEACLGMSFRVELSQSTADVEVWQTQTENSAEWTNLPNAANAVLNFVPEVAGTIKVRAKLAAGRGFSGVAAIKVYPIPVKPEIVKSCTTLSVLFDGTVKWYKVDEYDNAVHTGNSFTPDWGVSYVAQTNAHGCMSPISESAQLSQNIGIDVITACGSYTWIDGNTYTESNHTATFTLVGGAKNGCDSIVTLNLTVNTVDVSVTDTGEELRANATNATYQWLDCDENNAPIAGETNATFKATKNGKFAVQVTQNGCTDVSECVEVTNVGVRNLLIETIKMYPNPAKDDLMLDLGKVHSQIVVKITDMLGHLVETLEFENCRTLKLTAPHVPGMYFIKVTSQEQEAVMKLMK